MTDAAPDIGTIEDEYEAQRCAAHNNTEHFKVDSALLREFGERLVGKPHIALAELIKNAYDADASRCIVKLTDSTIQVSDDGHGMTEQEFKDYWMMIGTRHKQDADRSRLLKRPLTGSKGVGRLSVQFLSHKMRLMSTVRGSNERLHAFVDWDKAVSKKQLTQAEAEYRADRNDPDEYPDQSPHGTTVVLHGLKQTWSEEEVTELGRQIWMLDSPVRYFGRYRRKRDANDFRVDLDTDLPGVDEAFATQMIQALENYMAIITGTVKHEHDKSVSLVTVKFDDEDEYSEEFDCPPYLHDADWEIRVFRLTGRQRGGVAVTDMRDYFSKYGGVMVFDSGFRMSYYGIENDWLDLEFDHSHRRNRSKLLPDHLHTRRALNDLPTQGRIFGVVNVNTKSEKSQTSSQSASAEEILTIQVSRDRLVANKAFIALKESVRRSLDYYATLQRRRVDHVNEIDRASEEQPEPKLRKLRSLVSELRLSYPENETIVDVEQELDGIEASISSMRESDDASRAMLGPLASAGMAALAIEHEARKDIQGIRSKLTRLKEIAGEQKNTDLDGVAIELSEWLDRLEATRNIFLPLMNVEDRERTEALECEAVTRSVVASLQPLLGNVKVEFNLCSGLRFPIATYSEWAAILQNVILNATNATLDSQTPKAEVSTVVHNKHGYLRVSDNGVGIGEDTEQFFKPFSREANISDERRELGMGGVGLGLTIVKTIAESRNCDVRFVKPDDSSWSTVFEMRWRVE